MKAAFLEPDLLLVGQVGGHRRVGDAQLLDIDFANDLADLPKHLVATNGTKAEADIDQTQYVQVIQAFDPVAVFIQFARRVYSPDHRAHRAAGNAGDLVAAPFDFLDHAYMGIAPSAPRSQHQCYTFAHDLPRLLHPWSYNAPSVACASM